jgi:signal transduction histidine kinase
LLQQKRFLEKEVLIRTREQKSLIKSLEHTITELEESKEQLYQNNLFKERLRMIVMHDLQSPLRFLFDATRRAHEKSIQKRYSELEEINLELFKASGKIYNFVSDFGWWLSTTGSQFKTQNEIINLPDLLAELNQFFAEQLKANGNKIAFAPDGIRFIHSDRQLLKIILRNVLDNANKHTKKGIIEIRTLISNGSGKIVISDSGFGMDHELLAKLRIRLNEKSSDYSEKESGFGYRFITDLSRLLNIKVDIESGKGSGTFVTFSNIKINS